MTTEILHYPSEMTKGNLFISIDAPFPKNPEAINIIGRDLPVIIDLNSIPDSDGIYNKKYFTKTIHARTGKLLSAHGPILCYFNDKLAQLQGYYSYGKLHLSTL